jgi:cytochrome c-type biogenesis protein CcmE
MSPVQKKRMIVVVSLVMGLSVATGLVLFALKQNINLFYSPSQLLEQKVPVNKTIRVGGMVVKNSVVRNQDLAVEFVITDYQQQMK